VHLDWDSEQKIPSDIEDLLAEADEILQAYWDQWHRRPIEQYVACDFRDVYRAMSAWDAVGIEAEGFLAGQAKSFLQRKGVVAEIWQGNFLPTGSERLAKRQANHASLFHQVPSVYQSESLDVDDFSIIFAYPWPGEDYFLKDVFRCYAADQAILLMFLGPYEIEVFQKRSLEHY